MQNTTGQTGAGPWKTGWVVLLLLLLLVLLLLILLFQVCGYTPILGLVIYDCLPSSAVPHWWSRPLMGPGWPSGVYFDHKCVSTFRYGSLGMVICCSDIINIEQFLEI